MVDELKHRHTSPWTNAAAEQSSTRISEVDNSVSLMSQSVIITQGFEASHPQQQTLQPSLAGSDGKLGFPERAFAAAGAAFLSAILVNPLDVAKVLHFFI